MSAPPPLPRVTLFVLAYRQETHVRAAIEGALAQTDLTGRIDGPLEILLSDDCSPDGTFAVMEAMAAAYTGPHTIVLNRNPSNLGLIGHLNHVMARATGDLVVQNAGDDVSHPTRVARLATVWSADPSVRALHSAVRRLDATGAPVDWPMRTVPMADVTPAEIITDSIPGQGRHLIGASMAWDRRLWDDFGPLPAVTRIEDRPIAFRAALTGRIAWLEDALLDYREGGESDGGGAAARAYFVKKQRWYHGFQQAYLADLAHAATRPDLVTPAARAALQAQAEAERDRLAFEIGLAESGLAGRLARIPEAARLALARRDPGPLRAQLKYLLRPNG